MMNAALASAHDASAEKRITRVLTMEIVRPVSATWGEIGPTLHDLRAFAAPIMNEVVTACALHEAARTKVLVAIGAGRNVEPAAKKAAAAAFAPTKTVSYRAATACGIDGQRAYYARAKSPTATTIRRATLYVPSAIVLGLSSMAFAHYEVWSKSGRGGARTLPTFRAATIPIDGAGVVFGQDEKGPTLTLKIREVGRDVFAVAVDGGKAHGVVRKLLDPTSGYQSADCKLLWLERKKKWIAQLTYSMPAVAPVAPAGNAMAVHLGIASAITACDRRGRSYVVNGGSQLLAVKAQFAARRKSLARHYPSLGSGAHGRGEARYREHVTKVADAEARFVRTWCQQCAARVRKVALMWNVSEVVVENYSASGLVDDASSRLRLANEKAESPKSDYVVRMLQHFPFAMLRSCIRNALELVGIGVREVESAYECCTCPKCGEVSADSDTPSGFTCVACGLRRARDHVAAWNLLNRAGYDSDGFQIDLQREQSAVAALETMSKGDL
jgi:hypothetical protein